MAQCIKCRRVKSCSCKLDQYGRCDKCAKELLDEMKLRQEQRNIEIENQKKLDNGL